MKTEHPTSNTQHRTSNLWLVSERSCGDFAVKRLVRKQGELKIKLWGLYETRGQAERAARMANASEGIELGRVA